MSIIPPQHMHARTISLYSPLPSEPLFPSIATSPLGPLSSFSPSVFVPHIALTIALMVLLKIAKISLCMRFLSFKVYIVATEINVHRFFCLELFFQKNSLFLNVIWVATTLQQYLCPAVPKQNNDNNKANFLVTI